jgi:hypothetical protein
VKVKAAALLLVLGACNHVNRADYFQGWQISLRYTPPTKGTPTRSGYLLERGPGNVIVLEHRTVEWIWPDRMTCDTIRVELPDPPRPGAMERPRAFNQHCPCSIGVCEEETLLRGRVTVREVNARSVVADLDLEFPGIRVRRAATFQSATPHEPETQPP